MQDRTRIKENWRPQPAHSHLLSFTNSYAGRFPQRGHAKPSRQGQPAKYCWQASSVANLCWNSREVVGNRGRATPILALGTPEITRITRSYKVAQLSGLQRLPSFPINSIGPASQMRVILVAGRRSLTSGSRECADLHYANAHQEVMLAFLQETVLSHFGTGHKIYVVWDNFSGLKRALNLWTTPRRALNSSRLGRTPPGSP